MARRAQVTALAPAAPQKKTAAPAAPAPASRRANGRAASPPAAAPQATQRQQQMRQAEEHGVKDVRAALAALEDQWSDTEEKSFADVDEGVYQVKIEKAVINHSKSSGRLQVSWDAIILAGGDGKANGRHLFWHDGIEDAEQRGFFRGRLARIGVEWPGKASELPDVLEGVLGSYAEVRVKKKDDFTNVYFNKAIDTSDLDTDNLEPSDDGQTDEPDHDANDGTSSEGGEGEQCNASFEDGDLTPKQSSRIDELAKKLDLDTSSYSTKVDMLLDMAEANGVYGDFVFPKTLIDQVFDALPE